MVHHVHHDDESYAAGAELGEQVKALLPPDAAFVLLVLPSGTDHVACLSNTVLHLAITRAWLESNEADTPGGSGLPPGWEG